MKQENTVQSYVINEADQQDQVSAVVSNPRIVQLDAILNRSRFIWAREQSQQASNNN